MLMRGSWRARLDYLRSGKEPAMPSGSHVLRVLQTYHNSISCISMLHHSGHWNSFMSLWSCNRGLVFSPVVSIDPNASWSGTHFLAPRWMGFLPQLTPTKTCCQKKEKTQLSYSAAQLLCNKDLGRLAPSDSVAWYLSGTESVLLWAHYKGAKWVADQLHWWRTEAQELFITFQTSPAALLLIKPGVDSGNQ